MVAASRTACSVQDQNHLFWSQTGLVLRPTVSDHITAENISGAGAPLPWDKDYAGPR